MRIAPWRFLGQSDSQYLTQLLRAHDYIPDYLEEYLHLPACVGRFEYPLDIAFVKRGTSSETLFGPIYAEIQMLYVLVQGAGWSDKLLAVAQNDSQTVVPVGCGLIVEEEGATKGTFFDAALAQLYVGNYIETQLKLPFGLGNTHEPPQAHSLPSKYMIGTTNYLVGSIAAHGMELLIERDPSILQIMRSCHVGAPLKKLQRAVNQVGGKGLYEYLFNMEYGEANFLDGRNAIAIAVA